MSFQDAVKNVLAGGSGLSSQDAAAIVASASRNASPAAKRKNPKLKKVKGSPKKKAGKKKTH